MKRFFAVFLSCFSVVAVMLCTAAPAFADTSYSAEFNRRLYYRATPDLTADTLYVTMGLSGGRLNARMPDELVHATFTEPITFTEGYYYTLNYDISFNFGVGSDSAPNMNGNYLASVSFGAENVGSVEKTLVTNGNSYTRLTASATFYCSSTFECSWINITALPYFPDGSDYFLPYVGIGTSFSYERLTKEDFIIQSQNGAIEHQTTQISNKIDSATNQITGSIQDSTDQITGSIQQSTQDILTGNGLTSVTPPDDSAVEDALGSVTDKEQEIEELLGGYDQAVDQLDQIMDPTLDADIVSAFEGIRSVFTRVVTTFDFSVVLTFMLVMGLGLYIVGRRTS